MKVAEKLINKVWDVLKHPISGKFFVFDTDFYEGVGFYHTVTAAVYGETGRFDKASAHFELGLSYSLTSQFREAVDAYKRAVTIRPNYADAYYHLVKAYLSLGDEDSAREAHKTLEELDRERARELLSDLG